MNFEQRKGTIRKHTDLEVYERAFVSAMKLFEVSKKFPKDEQYSLTNQLRRSSRSVCANLAEAWRKRRYPGSFVSKLSDAEGEAAETQTWIQFAFECSYLDREIGRQLYAEYDDIIGKIVTMINQPEAWAL